MSLRRCTIGIALGTLLASAAMPVLASDVEVALLLRNQNLAVSFVDLSVSDQIEDFMRVRRLYSSISTFSHVFGYGWGSDLDTNLIARPDGELWYTTYGNGFTRIFSETSGANSQDMRDQIAEAARQQGMIGSDDEYEAYKKMSPWDAMDQYAFMRYAGYLVPADTTAGSVFNDYENGAARVVAFPEGYQLLIVSNATNVPFDAYFDNAGRILHTWVHGNPQRFVSYRWGTIKVDDSGFADRERVLTMTDYRGNVFHFSYDSNGRVKRVDANRFAPVTYGYDRVGNLTRTRDASGLYRYDYDEYHNLKQIDYPNGKTMTFSYENNLGYLKKLKCPDGTSYEFDKLSEKDGYVTSMRIVVTRGNSVQTETKGASEMGVYSYCS